MSIPSDAERQVLGSLFLDPDAIHRVREIVDADDFSETHRPVFRAACSLADNGQPVDVLTLLAQARRDGLQSGALQDDYLTNLLVDVISAASCEHYARIVFDAGLRRRLIATADHIKADATADTLTTDELITRTETQVGAATRMRRRDTAQAMPALLDAYYTQLERVMKERRIITGTATGFSRFDHMTQGLQPGDLIILAARPSSGKTSLALNIALHAAGEGHVAFFSLEMSRMQLIGRLVSSESGVDSQRLKVGTANPEEVQRVMRACARMQPHSLTVDDGLPMTAATIRSAARRLHAQQALSLVIVDYLQLVQPESARVPRNEQMAAVSAAMKQLAREVNVPVVALSQLSRESERRNDKRPQLSDLRDSGALEQDADVVAFLHRTSDDPGTRWPVDLIVAKHRNGPVGTIPVVFDATITRFREVDPFRVAS